ncbi:hypothetical protein OTK49_02020 [Vibrio coralliirubri]|uniref:hypothetical protein n=1 Tax=Vibrio coralliirubri TaxID=1516159 RepID=UPI00228503E1|nr:hypothetical protein [Vibrio coralliirubri]MCY9861291.1 hypothetical protein [Vibrio coralliirubri]
MFFTVADGKEGDTLVGRVSVPRDESGGSFKALRCLSVLMSEVDAVIRSVILQGKPEVEAVDVMGLNFKKSPSTRGSLANLKKGQRGLGWVPDVEVLHAMGHEFEQFLAHVNQIKAEMIADIKSNPQELIGEVKGNLNLVLSNYSDLNATEKRNLRDAVEQLG